MAKEEASTVLVGKNILGSQDLTVQITRELEPMISMASAEKSVSLESEVLPNGNESPDTFQVDSSAEKPGSLESEVLTDGNTVTSDLAKEPFTSLVAKQADNATPVVIIG